MCVYFCVPLVLYADAVNCPMHDHVKVVTYLFTKRTTQIKMLFLCSLQRHIEGVEVWRYLFLISALDGSL
jgi:hypothetical protein